MSYIIPPGFANVALRHTITGDSEEMVCNLGIDLSGQTGTDQDVVDDVFEVWALNLKTCAPNTVTFVGGTMYVGQDGGDPTVFDSTSAPVVGVSSGSSIPPNTALVFKKQTGLGGRAHRGRMFFPGASEGLITPAGLVDAALVTQCNTSLSAFLAQLAGVASGVLRAVLLHTTGSVLPPDDITAMVVDAKVGSQRRRLRP